METPNSSLFDAQAGESPAGLAGALATPAAAEHYDELRGATRGHAGNPHGDAPAGLPGLTGPWRGFFNHLGHQGLLDLNRRSAQLARQIRDNGVTYNVYADTSGPQRPWSLELFPLIIPPGDWRQIEAGVLQRMQLLEQVLADVYGPQQLLAKGLLPPALVQGHPGYLREMHGAPPAAGPRLHVAAFDLARGPDGHWWVVSQSTEAPSGLGYLLENRIAISRQFPQAFQGLHIQRLAATYRALIDNLKQLSSAGADAHIALLTPGPYNETYFEHAYLARYLGITLVEGSDLTVRDQHVYLRTLRGLEPVHGLLKRLDDPFLDPLELRPDSRLGVPGLLQAIRAGNVLVANAPGAGFLESSALLGFLPALSRHFTGEKLLLPAMPTWWCGERAAMQDALPRLQQSVIKPTYVGSRSHGSFHAVLGRSQSRRQLDEWAGRIMRQGDAHTVQSYLPLSQMPTWRPDAPEGTSPADTGRIVPRSVLLRVYAVSDGPRSWRVLPGGLARIASADAGVASMQRGGGSADVWVMTDGEVDNSTLLPARASRSSLVHGKRVVTSRAAENLFWLGRYTERTENTIRLARLTLESLNGEDQSSQPLLAWLSDLAVRTNLVLPDVPAATQARRVFERSLVANLTAEDGAGSVGYNLRATRLAASSVRERLSQEQWKLIGRAEAEFFQRFTENHGDYATTHALQALEAASMYMAAMTGAQTDRMTRDDGWRLLSIGRHIERLGFLSTAMAESFETGAVHDEGGFEALVALFDSTITFHAQYQQRRDIPALLDLLVLDRDNPRSLGWVAQSLGGRLAKLAGTTPDALDALGLALPDPGSWSLAEMVQAAPAGNAPATDKQRPAAPRHPAFIDQLAQCSAVAYRLSERIGALYFTHSGEDKLSVGA
ncbi:MAG: circularly permuted type 2 ATP-grasp protein [Pseudomonadota bacterium]